MTEAKEDAPVPEPRLTHMNADTGHPGEDAIWRIMHDRIYRGYSGLGSFREEKDVADVRAAIEAIREEARSEPAPVPDVLPVVGGHENDRLYYDMEASGRYHGMEHEETMQDAFLAGVEVALDRTADLRASRSGGDADPQRDADADLGRRLRELTERGRADFAAGRYSRETASPRLPNGRSLEEDRAWAYEALAQETRAKEIEKARADAASVLLFELEAWIEERLAAFKASLAESLGAAGTEEGGDRDG